MTQIPTLSSVVSRGSDQVSSTIDDEVVLMSIEEGSYFCLNETGSEIWNRIAEPVSVATLCQTLADIFDGPPQEMEADVLALLGELADKGLIEVTA